MNHSAVNKNKYIFLTLFIAVVTLSSCGITAVVSKSDKPWAYEIENMGVGTDGSYAIMVWTYSKTPQISQDITKKNAIHATIFKGIPAGNGSVSQPSLAQAGIKDTDPFFIDFFKSDYQKFIHSILPGSAQVYKVSKNEYKIGYVVSVSKDELRTYLEEQEIIEGLSEGF